MSRRATLDIPVPPELAGSVARLVASGRCGIAIEVIRAGLRLLPEKEGAVQPVPLAKARAKARPKRQ